jgi:hypothetical protein
MASENILSIKTYPYKNNVGEGGRIFGINT